MEKIHYLSKMWFYIIEDGSHAIGAEYNKTKVGHVLIAIYVFLVSIQ